MASFESKVSITILQWFSCSKRCTTSGLM